MYLVKNGFSIADIEKLETEYDSREYKQLMIELGNEIKEEQKRNQILRFVKQIEIADSIYYGFAATQSNKGYGSYKRWRSGLVNKINRLNGKKQETVWDKLKRKSNKIQ